MVEPRWEDEDQEDQGWGDDNDEENEDWDGWDYGQEQNVDFAEPGLDRKGSSFDNAIDIYSTRKRMDINFVNES